MPKGRRIRLGRDGMDWAGHAADNTQTSKVYTHFSPEFMLKEAQKVDYIIEAVYTQVARKFG